MTTQTLTLPWPMRAVSFLCLLFILVLPFEEAYIVVPLALLVVGILSARSVWGSLELGILWPAILGLLLAIPLLAGLATAYEPGDNAERALRLVLLGVAASVVVARFRQPVATSWWLAILFGVVLVWVADGLLQYFTGANILGDPVAPNRRLTGLFYPSIAVGTFVAHCSPLVYEFLRRFAFTGFRRLAWLVVFPVIAVVAFGGSRASWVALVLCTLLYLVILIKASVLRWRWVMLGLVGAVGVVWLLYETSTLVQQRIDQTALVFSGDFDLINRATANRLPIWQVAWEAFLAHPVFGIGISYFQDYITSQGLTMPDINYAHFFLLDVLMFTGLVGLVAYLAVYAVLIRHFIQAMWQGWYLTSAMFVGALVAMFPGNMHWGFYHYRPMALMWLFICLAYAFRYRERRAALERESTQAESQRSPSV